MLARQDRDPIEAGSLMESDRIAKTEIIAL